MRLTEAFLHNHQQPRSLSKHLLCSNVLELDTESLAGTGLLSNRSAWPPMSRELDELKYMASINIKVHRAHQAVIEQTVNLSTLLQAAMNQTHTHTCTSTNAVSLMISLGKVSCTTQC